MIKKIPLLIVITFFLICVTSCSEETSYNKSSYFCRTISGEFPDYPPKIVQDSTGNIYTTGSFQDTVDFDPSPGIDNHTSSIYKAAFITKLDANGKYRWTKTIYTVTPLSIALDNNDNIYLTGSFSGTDDFDPGTNIDNHTSSGYANIFITKINNNGSYGWTKTIRHSSNADTRDLAIDNSGNIYLTGYFTDTFYSNNVTITNRSNGGRDIFLIKFDSNGSYGWTKTFGGTSDDNAARIAIDNGNNIYLTGSFQKSVDFNPNEGVDSHTSKGKSDIFITKINSDGSYGWTKTMGGPYTDRADDIALDNSGNFYITGGFGATADFNPGPNTDNHVSNSDMDIFLCKIKADGSYGWTKTAGGFSQDFGKSIALNNTSEIYLLSYFKGTLYFKPETTTKSYRSKGSADIAITKFLSDGSYVWTKTVGGVALDKASSILYSSGHIYITGQFKETVDFNPGPDTDNHTANSTADIFIMRLDSK